MGENSEAIEAKIEGIEKEVERLSRTVKKLVRQYTKISDFLISQEKILTNKTLN